MFAWALLGLFERTDFCVSQLISSSEPTVPPEPTDATERLVFQASMVELDPQEPLVPQVPR